MMNRYLKTFPFALFALLPSGVLADWSGSYSGISVGTITDGELVPDDGDTSVVESGTTLSGFGGFQLQQGQTVFGGEVAIEQSGNASTEFDGDFDFFAVDLKGRVGYALDAALVYAVAGFSSATYTDEGGNELDTTGYNLGIGVDYLVTPQVVIGAEFLTRVTEGDFEGDSFDVETSTLSVRAAYRF